MTFSLYFDANYIEFVYENISFVNVSKLFENCSDDHLNETKATMDQSKQVDLIRSTKTKQKVEGSKSCN